jgi:hypothetical protein
LPGELRLRLEGRVIAHLAPRTRVERVLYRRTEAWAIFEEGAKPEDVIAGQASFYRRSEPEGAAARVAFAGGPPSSGPLAALSALFVEGKVANLVVSPSRAHLIPALERALAPLVDRSFLELSAGGADAAPAIEARSPLVVVPCFYASDELWFTARRVASSLAMGAAFDCAAPRVVRIADHWAQRQLFVDTLKRALASVGWTLREGYDGGALGAVEIGVIAVGGEDPVEALDRAPAEATEIMIHPLHEEDNAVAAALSRVLVRLRAGAVGLNAWPALLDFQRDGRMLSRADKRVLRGPLHAYRRPVYFRDNVNARAIGEALAAFHAEPGARALIRVLRAKEKKR